MASTEVSIKQLPTVSSIESGNFVIVQTENATNKLDFKDFVIGLENITFANTINENTTDIQALSGTLYGSFANTINENTTDIQALSGTLYGSVPDSNAGQSTHTIPITIGGVNYAIMLSATG